MMLHPRDVTVKVVGEYNALSFLYSLPKFNFSSPFDALFLFRECRSSRPLSWI